MKLTRKKLKAGAYNLTDESGTVIARADLTGSHLDDYPWTWYLVGELDFPPKVANTGSEDSLKACVDIVQSRANHYGLTKTV